MKPRKSQDQVKKASDLPQIYILDENLVEDYMANYQTQRPHTPRAGSSTPALETNLIQYDDAQRMCFDSDLPQISNLDGSEDSVTDYMANYQTQN